MRFIARSIKELRWRRDLYRLGLFSVVVAFIWIGLDLYRAYTQTQVPQVLKEQLVPLNPSIDLEQLERLELRISLSEAELNNFVPILEGEEAELVVISGGEEATTGGDLTTSPQATGSGGI